MNNPKVWYTFEEIEIGSLWFAADGSGHFVVVYDKQRDDIFYKWVEAEQEKRHDKSTWSFQVRYCLAKP